MPYKVFEHFRRYFIENYPKFRVAKKMKVGHEVFSIKGFSKELKASSGGPGGQTGWEQAQIEVQCVEENCPHLGKKKFWGQNPGIPQNQSSSHRRREFQDPQSLQGRTSNPRTSSLPTLQAPWKRIELIQSWYSCEKSVLLIGFIQCQSMCALLWRNSKWRKFKKKLHFLLKSWFCFFWAKLMSALISKWLDFCEKLLRQNLNNDGRGYYPSKKFLQICTLSPQRPPFLEKWKGRSCL